MLETPVLHAGIPVAGSPEERIIDATLRCIARWGVGKTTLDDAAREAGCSRATVYRLFPGGKDGLLDAVCRAELARFFVGLTGRLEAVAGHRRESCLEYEPMPVRLSQQCFRIKFWVTHVCFPSVG